MPISKTGIYVVDYPQSAYKLLRQVLPDSEWEEYSNTGKQRLP